ncbi:MAG: citrate synthase, partial [Elusimicrobia bacterium]|nr:citrate synthase [Elusimicrobiota bacterium]
TGRRPAPLDVEALDLYLVMLADHDLNASTLAGRVAASTLSDFYSSISAAIGALKGPLHGGANEKVMEMLIEVGDESRAEAYAEKALAQKRRIMGFGHRVFKSEDPRSRLLQEMARKLSVKKGETKWFRIAAKLEEAVSRRKRIRVNVDFYSAPLLHLLGIPWDLFPAVFAVSRIAGWSVHFVEQVGQNRLIHPLSRYTGPAERTFVPLERRGSS